MSTAPDFCTLVWPFLPSQEAQQREDSWLIGWNPRGLVVVVIAMVRGPASAAALDELERIRRHLLSAPAFDTAVSVAPQLLGRLRGAKPSVPRDASDAADGFVRGERRARDIWMELRVGPVLDEVWCCGYRVQPCHLQVVRTDPRARYAVTPTVFSATARFGCRGVRALVAGELPRCVDGARSSLEGVLLPPPMAAAAPRARPLRGHGFDGMPRSFARRERERGNATPVLDADAVEERPEVPPPPVSGAAPRLDFPTSADRAEFALLLRACNGGRNLCESVRQENQVGSSGSTSTHTREPHGGKQGDEKERMRFGRHMNTFLGVVVGALLIMLPFLKQLGRISSTGAMFELRVREIIHWLALQQGRTTVCGLHPILPHQQHKDPAFERFCSINFVSRYILDIILGTLISLLITLGGNALTDRSESISWYFLHELHLGYIDWFEGWPAGLKMNEDLDMTLCFFARVVLQFSLNGVLKELRWVSYTFKILVCIAPFGASCAFALISDVCVLVSLRLLLLFHLISVPYRVMNSIMGSLFLQFRGMKYNPLRRRTDAYDFEVDQMLMGTLLFTVTVFLFPTLLVHYLYFAFVCVSIRLAQESLIALAHLTLYLPIFPLFYWVMHRHAWPGGVALTTPILKNSRRHGNAASGASPASKNPLSTTMEVTVVSKPLELRAVLTDFLVVVDTIATHLQPLHLLAVIYQAKEWKGMNPVEKLIPHLQKDCIEPRCSVGWRPGEYAP